MPLGAAKNQEFFTAYWDYSLELSKRNPQNLHVQQAWLDEFYGRLQSKGIVVFAAASLKDALNEVAEGFHRNTGKRVTASYAASSTLAKGIATGAPADVFISAALVVDIGGALSHAAIVARELGVPCVVNTGTGSRRIRTGDRCRVDGKTGTITILQHASYGQETS